MLRRTTIALICLGLYQAALVAQQPPSPEPPADHSLIYVLNAEAKLVALPLETATTPLRTNEVARSNTTSYLELKGEHAAMVVPGNTAIYLFTIDRGGAHPPMIVWLTPHRGSRRVTAVAERGREGFAISSAEIVKPSPRGLSKNGDEVFMELRPGVSLMPGEYAIIGNDLTRVATFRVMSATIDLRK